MEEEAEIDENENGEVSVMSEVDIAEDMPNGDDSAFANDDHQARYVKHENEETGVDSDQHVIHAAQDSETVHLATHGQAGLHHEHVYVATSQGTLLTADQLQLQDAGIKTTHIVIHDQTLTVGDAGETLKTPTTPLPPPTPATPSSKEKGYKYQWDDSVHLAILPVRCKSSNGLLHKSKFGSGGRGRCIKMNNNWYTPSEFEAICGRASSKDWKRSVRYGGRTLQCLIEDGILQPHATSCTCAACCDDETVTGPVRLFTPYKRRKRDSEAPTTPTLRKRIASTSKAVPSGSIVGTQDNANHKDVVVSLAGANSLGQPLRISNTETGETIQIMTADYVTEPTLVMAPMPQTPKNANNSSNQNVASANNLDVNEQKQWWQLEEIANNLLQQAQQLKSLVEQAKLQSISSKETALHQLRQQMEKEKAEAINGVRIEGQVNLSRAMMQERTQKDIAIQQALNQARAEMQSEEKVTYVAWTSQENQNNIGNIMDGEESDKEKE